MEQSSLFGDGVDIDTETPASTDTAVPADARAQAAARAAELRHELDYHAYRYYMLDAPEITDAAFDKMLVELQEIEAAYPDLVTPDSYTQRVGGYVSEQFTPVTHMARMYSMDDAMDLDELDAWLQRTEDALGAGSVTYTCELKIDGLGVAGGIMPAIGFAVLLKIMMKNVYIPYFILGFVAAAWLKLPVLAIAAAALAMALIDFLRKSPEPTAPAAQKEEFEDGI